MPVTFKDYESQFHVSNQHQGQQRQSVESPSHFYHPHSTTSGPTSASTTRSSFSSHHGTNSMSSSSVNAQPPLSRRQRLSQVLDNTNPFLHNTSQDATNVTHNHHDQRSSYHTIEPTESIQVWAHRVHIQQKRSYDWCSECHPKTEPLHVPTEKALRRVRIQEPTHAYD